MDAAFVNYHVGLGGLFTDASESSVFLEQPVAHTAVISPSKLTDPLI